MQLDLLQFSLFSFFFCGGGAGGWRQGDWSCRENKQRTELGSYCRHLDKTGWWCELGWGQRTGTLWQGSSVSLVQPNQSGSLYFIVTSPRSHRIGAPYSGTSCFLCVEGIKLWGQICPWSGTESLDPGTRPFWHKDKCEIVKGSPSLSQFPFSKTTGHKQYYLNLLKTV